MSTSISTKSFSDSFDYRYQPKASMCANCKNKPFIKCTNLLFKEMKVIQVNKYNYTVLCIFHE